jgi:hypothetical protein
VTIAAGASEADATFFAPLRHMAFGETRLGVFAFASFGRFA